MGVQCRALALLAALLLAAPASRAADPDSDFDAYRALFSTTSLGTIVGPSLATAWTLHYRGAMPHAAFGLALGSGGRAVWRMVSGLGDEATARRVGQASCDQEAVRFLGEGATCRLIALDGRIGPDLPAVLTPRSGTIGPFREAPLLFRHGPRAAAGVLVWSHGHGGPSRDLRGTNTPGFVSAFNDAGWDVLRFDRPPGDDYLPAALSTLLRGLPLLRESGYRRIALAGQSRGGWQSIMAASQAPEFVDAVIAAAPAAHGETSRPNNLPAALEDFRRLLAGLPADRIRLGVALFENDPFDPDPAGRAGIVAELTRTAPTLALLPSPPIQGHAGAFDWQFTRSYTGCLLTLLAAPPAATPRGTRRAACGGG